MIHLLGLFGSIYAHFGEIFKVIEIAETVNSRYTTIKHLISYCKKSSSKIGHCKCVQKIPNNILLQIYNFCDYHEKINILFLNHKLASYILNNLSHRTNLYDESNSTNILFHITYLLNLEKINKYNNIKHKLLHDIHKINKTNKVDINELEIIYNKFYNLFKQRKYDEIYNIYYSTDIVSLLNDNNDKIYVKKVLSNTIELDISYIVVNIHNIINDTHQHILKYLFIIGCKYGIIELVKLLLNTKNFDVCLFHTLTQSDITLSTNDYHVSSDKYLSYICSKAIFLCTDHGYNNIIKLLLNNILNQSNINSNDYNYTIHKTLAKAVKKNNIEIVKFILYHNYYDGNNRLEKIKYPNTSALVISAQNGCVNIVKMLLEYKIYENDQLSKNDALSLSIENGNAEIIKLLINNGANAETCIWSITKYIHCCKRDGKKCDISLIKMLLDILFKNHVLATEFYDIFTESVINGYTDIVQYLLEKGISVNIQQGTPLLSAIEYEHIDMVKLLIEKGANINCNNKTYPLMKAIDKENIEIIEILLEKGANVHVAREHSLVIALNKKNKKILKILLKHGADLNMLDPYEKEQINKIIYQ
jgi:hypothetical protein